MNVIESIGVITDFRFRVNTENIRFKIPKLKKSGYYKMDYFCQNKNLQEG